MTELGKAFERIAYNIVRLHGMGSNKMSQGYTVSECDQYEVGERNRETADLLERLVAMGYLRKFTTQPVISDRKRNWRYRHMEKHVCFGLTAKGWAVAEQYIVAAHGADEFKRLVDYHTGSVDTFNAPDFDEWLAGWDEYVN